MEAELKKKTEALAVEIATQATTLDDLNGLMRTLMKSALESRRAGTRYGAEHSLGANLPTRFRTCGCISTGAA